MFRTIIITGGSKYIDIDVLACAVAYEEFFQLKKIPAKVVLSGFFNETIPAQLKQQYAHLENNSLDNKSSASFILVDVSNPKYFPAFVDHQKIKEVWDHHGGFEAYWEEGLGENAHIEMVGACATLIWEQFVKHDLKNQISSESANLLSIAIVSNTLNLNANITHQRDKQALRELEKYISLPKNWIEQYYQDTTKSIEKDPYRALMQDKKDIDINGEIFSIGQLELWSAREIMGKYDMLSLAKKALSTNNNFWFLNMPSISEGKNYFITASKTTQELLEKHCNAKFKNDIGIANQLYLRKEVIHLLQSLVFF